jgi:hypothetical protein
MSSTTTGTITTPTATYPAKTSIPQQGFNDKLDILVAKATNEDHAAAKELSASGITPHNIIITAVVAAVLFSSYNGVNRGFRVSKAQEYADAMLRGEWMVHHQGIAFYGDGTIADGQHRMGALILSNTAQEFQVSGNFNKAAIDTIDRAGRRSAGESLEMQGVVDGKLKATVSKVVMNYTAELHGDKPRYSDPQIEAFVIENNALLERALALGYDSTQNVSDPAMTTTVARQLAALMLLGGWEMVHTAGFVASVQQGVASYADSPIIQITKALLKSNVSDRRKDRLNGKQKLALLLKGAVLWSAESSVARLVWTATKEDLPTNVAPASAFDTSAT